MFGTSGIRGIVGQDITPELFSRVALASARAGGKLAIATDTRPSSQMLKCSFIAGALAAGSDTFDLGIAPTPALAYAAWRTGEMGAMVTASHNPPNYNGLKLFSGGLELSREAESEIARKMSGPQAPAGWSNAGSMFPAPSVLPEYLSFLEKAIAHKSIQKAKPRIVLDCANGAGSVATPPLLSRCGAHVIGLNCETGGHFNRPLEPTAPSLATACSLVRLSGADFGLAHDGDADRVALIDERGRPVPQDVALALMIQYGIPKGKKPIATTVEASLIVRDAIRKRGAKPIITPVGSMHVSHEVHSKSLLFGGEPCGEYVFGGLAPAADGVASALMFAKILSENGSRLSMLASRFKQYPILREKFPCPNKKKEAAMKKISATLRIPGKRSEIDGLRIDFPDGWVLVRPSGTEPVMRLTCEAKRQKKLSEVAKEAREAIIAACR